MGAAVDAEGRSVADAVHAAAPGTPGEPGADRGARREQLRRRPRTCDLAQRRDVVEDPERAAVGAGHQVAALHLQVVDRTNREAAHHPGPRLAVVDPAEHTAPGPNVEQA